MLSGAMWKTQSFLHNSDSKTLPVLLMVAAGSLVMYRHMTSSSLGKDPLKSFLAMIVIEMLPLLFLEVKILACPDPVTVLPKFGAKVMLMHMAFLALRVFIHPFAGLGFGFWNLACLLGACVVLRVGFNMRFSLRVVWEHFDTLCLVCLALFAAFLTETLHTYWMYDTFLYPPMESFLMVASDYIEIMAFVPAVWVVLQAVKQEESVYDRVQTTGDPRKQAVLFFAFLISFYFSEDILAAFELRYDLPLASAGHTAHFLLLLDFAGFLLAQLFNAKTLKGSLCRWLNDVVVPV